MATIQEESKTPAEKRRPLRVVLWLGGAALVSALVLAVIGVLLSRRDDVPDVGEPFDVEKFESFSLPNEKNAISQYLLAQRALVRFDSLMPVARIRPADESARAAALNSWNDANPDARAWLKANRKALELWKIGAARDESIEVPYESLNTYSELPASTDARIFVQLALLEASRLIQERRAADAWSWYRASLRASRHHGMHAVGIGRQVGASLYQLARDPILNWSARPEIAGADLRQALADAVGIDAMTAALSENFKVQYLAERTAVPEVLANLVEKHPWAAIETRFSGRPECMRRALKLFFANWIAYADQPRHERVPSSDKSIGLFEPGPGGDGGPDLPPPEVLKSLNGMSLTGLEAHASMSSVPPIDFALPGMRSLFDVVDQEQVNRAAVIVGLGLELYYREHGHFPQTLSELTKVGTLKSIPLDPFGQGEPIHYRVEGNPADRAVVWSVGLDRITESGKLPTEKIDERISSVTVFEIKAPRKSQPGRK
jgi:hypothetical protein